MDRLYDPHKQTILVLGEASFSFAAALATTPIATSHGIHGLVASTLHPSVQHAEGAHGPWCEQGIFVVVLMGEDVQ